MGNTNTVILQSPRVDSQHFIDIDGNITYVKDEDSISKYVLDYTDVLDSGDTISSVSTSATGVTIDSEATATPLHTMTVSKTGGYIKATATTANGLKFVNRLCFVPPHGELAREYSD